MRILLNVGGRPFSIYKPHFVLVKVDIDRLRVFAKKVNIIAVFGFFVVKLNLLHLQLECGAFSAAKIPFKNATGIDVIRLKHAISVLIHSRVSFEHMLAMSTSVALAILENHCSPSGELDIGSLPKFPSMYIPDAAGPFDDWRQRAIGFLKTCSGVITDEEEWRNAVSEIWSSPVKKTKTTCKKCGNSFVVYVKSNFNLDTAKCPKCNPGHYEEEKVVNLLDEECRPVPSLDDLSSCYITHCQFIAGGLGSPGVVLVRSETGHFIVKIGSQDTLGEYWAAILGAKLGLHVPCIKVFSVNSIIGGKLLDGMRHAKWSHSENCHLVEKIRYHSYYFSVIEFLPGSTLSAALDTNQRIPSLFYEVGSVFAFDILINNFDRMPLVWNNAGNPDNMICYFSQSSGWRVCPIDQMLVSIKNNNGLDTYCKHLDETLAELGSRNGGSGIDRIVSFLHNWCNYIATEIDRKQLVLGIQDGINSLVKLFGDDDSVLDELDQRVSEHLPELNLENFFTKHREYLNAVLIVLRKHRQ